MEKAQTLAHGAAVPSKYSGMGYRERDMIPPPHALIVLLAGPPSVGKTRLMLSCPFCYHINLDLSSTTYPQPPAVMWPGVHPETGAPIEPDGGEDVEIDFNWEAVITKMELLLDMAEDKWEGRPRMVSFDSVGSLIHMLKDWAVRNRVEIGICTEEKAQKFDRFNKMFGTGAWATIYDEFVDWVLRLRSAGYGVWVIDHVGAKIDRPEEGPAQTVVQLVGAGDGMYSRLLPKCQMLANMEKVLIEDRTKDKKVIAGKSQYPKVEAYRFVTQPPKDEAGMSHHMRNLLKKRVALTKPIIIPERDPWSTFSKGYQEAATRAIKFTGDEQ